ncbi:hypothetical protein Daesc_002034 [Daldinia eschscholtzii]|uniref:Uncharacterized protein n=1 Tax=Daldinia eschscholtzii TaxID=292717 RepID=A0AAX6MW78_9PEZI
MSSAMEAEFPTYLKAFFSGHLVTSDIRLGVHAHDLRFTVLIDPFSKKRPLLLLYDGPTYDGDVLVRIGKTKDHLGTYLTGIEVNNTTITLTNRKDDMYRRHIFTLELGESRREKFEWRPTEGNEVHDMFKHAKGFKLVRLKSKGPGDGKGGKRDERHIDETSDGKEVVAVWATEKCSLLTKFVPTMKPFKFELRASGKTGDLGNDFAYFALATALKIWLFESLRIDGVPSSLSLVDG